jgi:hypothetical protein
MASTRFEIVPDHDQLTFHLRTTEGQTLLTGLASNSKIMLQNEILHARKALRDPSHLVKHTGNDGSHWIVLKDLDGSVLAKSPHLPSDTALDEVIDRVLAVAATAPIVDLTKRAHAH